MKIITIVISCPPWVWFFAFAAILPLLRTRGQQLLLLAAPALGAWSLYQAGLGTHLNVELFGLQLELYRLDELSRLFAILFHLAALIGVVYSLHVRDSVQHSAALIYVGSAIGAVCAGDLMTLFLFWEGMAFSSTFLVWARRNRSSFHSGLRYLAIQVLSGTLLLVGLLWHQQDTGSLEFGFIGLQGAASWLIFLAFGIKCAFPLLHNWLTDAYAEATPTGTVFLCAFTTKVAIYALARGFPGVDLLIYIGALMTCFPIFYAVIENDLRRVLGYSMINQLGFMVCGIGVGTELAINGAVAHAFNDVLFKGLLFMSMGAVLHVTGRIRGSELGGLYKTMPITTGFCLVGAASISAFPLFCGFVSKAMIISAVLKEGHVWIWPALLFASAGVFHHAGIKIPYFAFFAHDSGLRATEPPLNMLCAMGVAALLCVLIGCFPGWLYALLPFSTDYIPYDFTHVLSQLQLLFFSALAFLWLRLSGLYPPELPSVNLDAEWLYRRLLPSTWRRCTALSNRLADRLAWSLANWRAALGPLTRVLRYETSCSAAVFWALCALSACLVFYYIARAL